MLGKAGQLPVGEGSLSDHNSICTQKVERELEVELGYNPSKPTPGDVFPPVRLGYLNFYNTPKQCYSLGTRCSKAWAYGGYFSFKLP